MSAGETPEMRPGPARWSAADVGQLLPRLEAQPGDGGIVRILRQQAGFLAAEGLDLLLLPLEIPR